jgi:hypothetical protein
MKKWMMEGIDKVTKDLQGKKIVSRSAVALTILNQLSTSGRL